MDLKLLYQVLQSLNEFFPKDTSIALSDNSNYLVYRPGPTIDLKITPGEPIRSGSISLQTLQERQKVSSHVPSHVFGVPYFGLGTPLYDTAGQITGVLTLIFPPDKAGSIIQAPKDKFLIGQVDEHFIPIEIGKIAFATSIDGVTFVHTQTEQFRVRHTLQELEWKFPSDQFVRCHRAFLVNVSYIQEIHRDFHSTFLLVMKDSAKTRIPVSQKYTSIFRRSLGF